MMQISDRRKGTALRFGSIIWQFRSAKNIQMMFLKMLNRLMKSKSLFFIFQAVVGRRNIKFITEAFRKISQVVKAAIISNFSNPLIGN